MSSEGASFDVLFTPLGDLSACLWNRECEFLAGWVGIHRYTCLHQRQWHIHTPLPVPNILSFSSTSLPELFFFLVIFNYQSPIWYRKTYGKSFPHSYSMSRQWLVYHFRIRDSPLFEGICESEFTTLSDLEVCRENSLIPFIHRYLINKKKLSRTPRLYKSRHFLLTFILPNLLTSAQDSLGSNFLFSNNQC